MKYTVGHRRTRRVVGGGGRPPGLENFQGKLCFQGKRKMLKNPECNTYIQYSEKFQGNSVFQGKRKLLKNPECKTYRGFPESRPVFSSPMGAYCRWAFIWC